MMKKNDVFTVKIDEINALGFGVCKIDGMAVFVGGGAPEDEAKIRIIKTAPTYAVARIEELIAPSPHRVSPTCPVAGPCGGCAYSHISYESERISKQNAVKAALRKAGAGDITVHPVCSPSPLSAYRNKAQMPFTDGCKVGYFAAKTHRVVVPPQGCELLPKKFRKIADEVCDFASQKGLSVYDESTGKGLLRHLYLRMGNVSGEVMVCLVINGKELPHAAELAGALYGKFPCIRTVLTNENTAKTNVILGEKCRVIFGDGIITDELCGNTYEISPLSFYQINHDTAEAIYRKAIELADAGEHDVLGDLYCGIGTIGLSAARLCPVKKVIGVEIIPDAVKNAKRNAMLNGIENAYFYCGDALDPHIEECNVMIVDPPRKGLSRQLIERIAEIGPERVVYVSCNPDTMARDIAAFAPLGYRTDEVFPYDMFPRTAHVETVALLRKQ